MDDTRRPTVQIHEDLFVVRERDGRGPRRERRPSTSLTSPVPTAAARRCAAPGSAAG